MHGHAPVGLLRPVRPVAHAFINVHVKCLIFSAKENEDAKSHLLCSNDWMNSKGTVEEVICGRLCLTLRSDVHL